MKIGRCGGEQRGRSGAPELLEILRAEILAVVSKHVELDPEKVVIRMDRQKYASTLEVDIEVPNGMQRSMLEAAT